MSPLVRSCYTAIRLILSQLVHLPGGYAWWHSLALKGKKGQVAVLRRWARLLSEQCYPLQLQQAMLYACLNHDGIPDDRGMALYVWMLRNIYRGNAVSMHHQWQQLHTAHLAHLAHLAQRQTQQVTKVRQVVLKPMPTKGMGTWHEYPPARHSVNGTPSQQYYNTSSLSHNDSENLSATQP